MHEAETGERTQTVVLFIVHEQQRQRCKLKQQFRLSIAIEIATHRSHAVVGRHPTGEPWRVTLPCGIERIAGAAALRIKHLRPAIRGNGLPVAFGIIELCLHDRFVVLANPAQRGIGRIERSMGVEIHAAEPFLHRLALGIEAGGAARHGATLDDHKSAVSIGCNATQGGKIAWFVAAELASAFATMRSDEFACSIKGLHLLDRASLGDKNPSCIRIHIKSHGIPQTAQKSDGLFILPRETHHTVSDEREDFVLRPECDVAHINQRHRIDRDARGGIEPNQTTGSKGRK